MGYCYWCYWGWPELIKEIYDDCVERAGYEVMHYGPAHVVWEDENWDSAQSCLDHFDERVDYREHTKEQYDVVKESLERLVKVPEEYKYPPEEFDFETSLPADFPPPKHWKCKK